MPNYTAQRPGGDSIAGRVFQDFAKVFEVTATELIAAAVNIPIDAGRTVIAVRTRVLTAFDGTTPAIAITDGTSNFLASADIAPATLNAHANSLAAGEALASGKYFATAGKLVVTLTQTNTTAGKLQVEVVFDGNVAFARDEISA